MCTSRNKYDKAFVIEPSHIYNKVTAALTENCAVDLYILSVSAYSFFPL